MHDIKIPGGKKKRFDFGMRPDVENSLQIKFVFNREQFIYLFYLSASNARTLTLAAKIIDPAAFQQPQLKHIINI